MPLPFVKNMYIRYIHMNPEDISKKAEQARQKNKKVKSVAKIPRKKTPASHAAFGFYTYSRIFPGGMNTMLWFMLNVVAVVFIALYYLDKSMGVWALYAAATCTGIFLIRWLIDLAYKASTYGTYKNFITDIGFEVQGWSTLGSYPNQLKARYWSKETRIEITTKEHSDERADKLIQDALYLFIQDAHKAFYQAEMGGDGRTRWKQEGHYILKGSANIGVYGAMYTLLHVYLRSIQQQYPVIMAVKIYFDKEIFEVSPPSSD